MKYLNKEAANDDKIYFDTIEKAIGYYINSSGKELNYTDVLKELYKKDQEIERLKLAMSEIERLKLAMSEIENE